MPITVLASVKLPLSIDSAFALAAGRTDNLSRFFTGYSPFIPAITRAALVNHTDPPAAGTLRDVDLSDGSKIQERVLAFDPPRLHRYEMARMNKLQRLICTNMVSEWRFDSDGPNASRIEWEYTIHNRSGLASIIARPVAWSFQRAMQTCLDNILHAAIAG